MMNSRTNRKAKSRTELNLVPSGYMAIVVCNLKVSKLEQRLEAVEGLIGLQISKEFI